MIFNIVGDTLFTRAQIMHAKLNYKIYEARWRNGVL